MKISFYAFGKVQGVMFRKTFVYGAKERELLAGATNDSEDRNKVLCSVEGEESEVREFLDALVSLETLNSWGARVENCQILDDFVHIDTLQVTTTNVDEKNWSSGVEFYL